MNLATCPAVVLHSPGAEAGHLGGWEIGRDDGCRAQPPVPSQSSCRRSSSYCAVVAEFDVHLIQVRVERSEATGGSDCVGERPSRVIPFRASVSYSAHQNIHDRRTRDRTNRAAATRSAHHPREPPGEASQPPPTQPLTQLGAGVVAIQARCAAVDVGPPGQIPPKPSCLGFAPNSTPPPRLRLKARPRPNPPSPPSPQPRSRRRHQTTPRLAACLRIIITPSQPDSLLHWQQAQRRTDVTLIGVRWRRRSCRCRWCTASVSGRGRGGGPRRPSSSWPCSPRCSSSARRRSSSCSSTSSSRPRSSPTSSARSTRTPSPPPRSPTRPGRSASAPRSSTSPPSPPRAPSSSSARTPPPPAAPPTPGSPSRAASPHSATSSPRPSPSSAPPQPRPRGSACRGTDSSSPSRPCSSCRSRSPSRTSPWPTAPAAASAAACSSSESTSKR